MLRWTKHPWQRNLNQIASGNPGAVQLTLHVLLSFAQFEREVTAERIRDKFAASKRKGIWMGGPVPLGYVVKDRKLVVNETEATTVRQIYNEYLKQPSIRDLVFALEEQRIKTKVQNLKSGGISFRRGSVKHLLGNALTTLQNSTSDLTSR